jgi:hypothetical protein
MKFLDSTKEGYSHVSNDRSQMPLHKSFLILANHGATVIKFKSAQDYLDQDFVPNPR